MRGEVEKTVDALNGFLRGEMSAVETYRQAIEKLAGSPTRVQLEICQRSHEQRVTKLRDQVARLGGEPSNDSGSWGAFARLVEGGVERVSVSVAHVADIRLKQLLRLVELGQPRH